MVIYVIHDAAVFGAKTVDWRFGPYGLLLRIIPAWVGIAVNLFFALCLGNGDCVFFCLFLRFIESGRWGAFNPVVNFRPL